MERRLNSRGTVRTAWAIVATFALGIGGFALYLLLPLTDDSGAGDSQTGALAAISVQPVGSVTPASGPARLAGTLERVEGRVLVLNTGSGGETTRVLIRAAAPVGMSTGGSVADIKPGEPVTATVRRQSDGRMLVVRIRLQPPEIPLAGPDGQRPTSSSTETQTITGMVAAFESNSLRIRTPAGERPYDLASSAPVTRFVPLDSSALKPGQRIVVDGERLVDGSIGALAVQVFDTR